MEALLAAASNNGAEETLIGNLRYGLDPQGSYVTHRRHSTTFSNVNFASPKSVKSITINCGSASEWMDPQSILLSMLCVNDSTTEQLFPASPNPAVLFDRLQIRLGSTLVEDIQGFNLSLIHI